MMAKYFVVDFTALLIFCTEPAYKSSFRSYNILNIYRRPKGINLL